jgi:hypothetical protein
MPFVWWGDLVGTWVMVPHIRSLLRKRFALLKPIAESDEWRQYLAKTIAVAEPEMNHRW